MTGKAARTSFSGSSRGLPGNFCCAATEKEQVDTSGKDKKARYTHMFPNNAGHVLGEVLARNWRHSIPIAD